MPRTKKLGIVSGSGPVAAIVARNAREKGYAVVSVALAETQPEGLFTASDRYRRVSIGHPETVIGHLRSEGVRDLVIVGKFPRDLHFMELDFDKRALAMLSRLGSRDDLTFFRLIAQEMEKEGFRVRKQTDFLGRFLAGGGVLTATGPSEEETAQLRRAQATARWIAKMGIGQTLVVRDGLVIAVEAFEHTDATIRRAGKLAGEGTAVIKVSSPEQDPRFDVPTVGLHTLKVMNKAGAKTLVVEKGKPFLLDREAMIDYANRHQMVVVVL